MRCLRCGNKRIFHHFSSSIQDYVIKYNEDDEDLIEDQDLNEIDPAGTVTIQCDICEFESLPEAFRGRGQFSIGIEPIDWPKVEFDEEEGAWYIPNTVARLDSVIIKGRGYLPDIGETYAKLRAIHYASSVDALPEYLADGAIEVRNFALERKAKIEEKE